MKKSLLIALALLVSTVSFAQFRTAPREAGAPVAAKSLDYGIASNFTTTTLDGQTIVLQDWLDSGYYVLLDISATWCGWCWYLHQAHVLENIYNNYGPNGTDEMRVLWVEGDASTAVSEISSPSRNWTAGVSYPIADDANVSNLFGVSSFPTVLLICPSGYYQDAYDVCDWNGSAFVTNTSVAAIYNLLGNCPAAGVPPVVEVDGLTTAVANSPVSFHASYISVDPVTAVEWSIPGATPSTGTGDDITVTFPSTGNYTVTLNVTNTSGTATQTLNVNVIEWDWDNTMTYDINGQFASSVGGPNPMVWAAKYPAALMSGRNYLNNVQVYSPDNGQFTLKVYQTNPGVDPTNNDLLYQYDYAVTAQVYNTLTLFDRIQLDDTKDLWISFTCTGMSYPAAGCSFTGDPNGSLIYYQNAWAPIYDLNAELMYTWMIKATTSATAPAINVAIDGPASGNANDPIQFTAAGPAAASYSWSFDGGEPATATGNVATTSFATAGNHTVTLTATIDGETATATHTINIFTCDLQTLPWSCGFEASDNLACWSFLDADQDGNGWGAASTSIGSAISHNGSESYASASFINGVGAVNPDNWMITPKIQIPADGATIEWYDYGVDANDFADHYGVFVSTTGNNPADFNNSIFDGAPTAPRTWAKHSRSLAGFAGQEVYIAFRHYNITNMFWLCIDDVRITSGNTAGIDGVENANITLYPNPVNSILHIDAQSIQEVSVLDVNGRTVMTEQNTNTIDMSTLANGVYFVRVITTEGVSTQKVTKK